MHKTIHRSNRANHAALLYDLIQDLLQLDLPNDESGTLFERLSDSLGDIAWCESDPYGLKPFELAKFSWNEFSRVVKHGRRYFFGDHKPADRQLLTPAILLDRIVKFAEFQGLFIELTPEVPLFRARPHAPAPPWTEPKDLGPPPPEEAKQSRMSPAGITMLYVSDEPQTALAEIRANCEEISVGCFRVTRPALILGLKLLKPPVGIRVRLGAMMRCRNEHPVVPRNLASKPKVGVSTEDNSGPFWTRWGYKNETLPIRNS